MSEQERGNFSEDDITSEEQQEKLRNEENENREGKILEEFEWQDEKGVVRYATKEDHQGIIEVDKDRAAFREITYHTPHKDPSTIKADTFPESIREPDKLAFIVLEIGDEIVGYSEFGPAPELGPGIVTIRTTSVLQMDPKYKRRNEQGELRGFGFGEKLRVWVIKEAKNIFHAKELQSGVHNWNKPSIALWEKLGSKRIEEVPKKDEHGNPIMVFDPITKKEVESVIIRFSHNLDVK